MNLSRRMVTTSRPIIAKSIWEEVRLKFLHDNLIYKGKTKRSIPSAKFPAGFLLSANPRHWSNEEETIMLLDGVIKPYLEKTKEELSLEDSQKACIIWDAFKDQDTPEVKSKLQELNFKEVRVPKNMTHLFQALNLITNNAVKDIEKQEFTSHFTTSILSALQRDPDIDVTTIEIDLKLSTLKPCHAATMEKVYNFLKSEKGREIILSGWKAAGITEALQQERERNAAFSLNPYV